MNGVICKLTIHWCTKPIHHSKKMVGPDTTIAKFSHKEFNTELRPLDMRACKKPVILAKNINECFQLLDLENMTYEQISPI